MKKLLLSASLTLMAVLCFAQVHVSGYYRKNGTYVQPHMRSSPDSNPYNNYSYPGNTNPYTGKVATGNPDTYLNNYNKNSTSTNNNKYDSNIESSNLKKVKYIVPDKSIISGEKYLTFSQKQDTYVSYDIYDSSNIFNGFLIIYSDNTGRLFNKNFEKIKEIEHITQSSLIQQNQDYATLKPLSVATTNSSARIYLKNGSGQYTGFYLIKYFEDNIVTKYRLFNHADNFAGTVEKYANGDEIFYDVNGKEYFRTKDN